jgi:hypothetical protein
MHKCTAATTHFTTTFSLAFVRYRTGGQWLLHAWSFCQTIAWNCLGYVEFTENPGQNTMEHLSELGGAIDLWVDGGQVPEIGQRSTGPADTVPPLQHLLSAYGACFAQQKHRLYTNSPTSSKPFQQYCLDNPTSNELFMIMNSCTSVSQGL